MITIDKHPETRRFIVWRSWYNLLPRHFWAVFWFWKQHRIGYCQYPPCGMWCLNRRQVINRSTASAWMCEECAAEEQLEVDAAWAEYHSGCL